MTFVILSVSLSMLFCFVFLKKVFQSARFVFSLKNKEKKQQKIKQKKTNLIIKKKLIIAKKTVKNCYQTKPFFAKFLYEKEFQNYEFSLKFLINDIIKKIKTNVCFLKEKINFKLLQSAGFDLTKPVFLMKCPPNQANMFEKAVKVALQHVEFQPILLCDRDLQTSLRSIVLGDINLKLFQEINKINLNYNCKFMPYFNEIENDVDFFGKVERIYDFNNKKVSYFLNSNVNQKAKIFLKLQNFCYNVQSRDNKIELHFPNGTIIEYFTNSIITKIEKINIKGTYFLQVELKVLKNVETFLTSDSSFVSKKLALLKEKFEFEKIFGIKIFTKNAEFNSFFNSLPEKIFKEFKETNFFKKRKVEFNKNLFSEMFCLEETAFNFETFLELFEFLVKDVFGIKISQNKFFANPKMNLDFKVVINIMNEQKNIYISKKGRTELVVNGVVFSNIPFVDLNLIEKTAFLCV